LHATFFAAFWFLSWRSGTTYAAWNNRIIQTFHDASWTRFVAAYCYCSFKTGFSVCAVAERLKGKTKKEQQRSCFHKLSSKRKPPKKVVGELSNHTI
jgi:hypothetical protein